MSDGGIERNWIQSIAAWARTETRVLEIWAFGSRARDQHRSDSDLDLALLVEGDNDGERTTVAFFNIDTWQSSIQQIIPVPVDLHWLETDDVLVTPAVRDHGVRLYLRA